MGGSSAGATVLCVLSHPSFPNSLRITPTTLIMIAALFCLVGVVAAAIGITAAKTKRPTNKHAKRAAVVHVGGSILVTDDNNAACDVTYLSIETPSADTRTFHAKLSAMEASI
ncbi:Aste57867_23149 [Aphanomyces stellatus]|uniref:Aste57867_23149 protein n=1 Tax=Aphanomyces stellatus TaxID=120398 RepID=A0A485LNM6_9STRA|nr:hypothetical protein As57867_023078 [Aphanomyces stellatus]VFT99797.1 Aste57867_23149 [Aphanomyces stellatus]